MRSTPAFVTLGKCHLFLIRLCGNLEEAKFNWFCLSWKLVQWECGCKKRLLQGTTFKFCCQSISHLQTLGMFPGGGVWKLSEVLGCLLSSTENISNLELWNAPEKANPFVCCLSLFCANDLILEWFILCEP